MDNMQMNLAFASALAAALALGCSCAADAQVFTGAAANVVYQTDGQPLSPLMQNDQTLCGGPAPSSASSLSSSCGVSGAFFQGQGSASPGAVFHASASAEASNVNVALRSSPTDVTAIGLATYGFAGLANDTITFAGVVPASLTFSYLVNGTARTIAFTSGGVQLTPDVNVAFGTSFGGPAPLAFIFDQNFTTTGASSQTFSTMGSTTVALDGRDSITFSLQFATDALITDPSGTGLSGYALSDFSDTASFAVQAFDANGVNITEAAGMQFSDLVLPSTPAVPEPGTWALMLVGVAGLGAAARSRRTAVLATSANA